MKPIVACVRVSTSQQGRSGLGIEAQRETLSRFACDEGFEIAAELVEVETGTSAAPGPRRLDRRGLFRRDQYPPRATRVERGVCRAGRQGRGQPRLAQDEERLGRLECALARRRADRAADPRRDGRARSARQKSDLDLAARRARRAGRRPESAAGDQEHGRCWL